MYTKRSFDWIIAQNIKQSLCDKWTQPYLYIATYIAITQNNSYIQ